MSTPKHTGTPLTQAEVDALPDGAPIVVTWSGGGERSLTVVTPDTWTVSPDELKALADTIADLRERVRRLPALDEVSGSMRDNVVYHLQRAADAYEIYKDEIAEPGR